MIVGIVILTNSYSDKSELIIRSIADVLTARTSSSECWQLPDRLLLMNKATAASRSIMSEFRMYGKCGDMRLVFNK